MLETQSDLQVAGTSRQVEYGPKHGEASDMQSCIQQ